MKKIILFSEENPKIISRILVELFPKEIKNKIFAYIPSDGADLYKNNKYTPGWKERAKNCGVDEFLFIDNSKEIGYSVEEYKQILEANIVLLTGGNTYTFLRNMKRSGLDKALVEFTKKEEFVLAGYSAGAMILTPTIDLCKMDGFAENKVNLHDTTGIGIVDFEVFPHCDDRQAVYEEYKNVCKNPIRTIDNQGIIVLNL